MTVNTLLFSLWDGTNSVYVFKQISMPLNIFSYSFTPITTGNLLYYTTIETLVNGYVF